MPAGAPSPLPLDPNDLPWDDVPAGLLGLVLDDLQQGREPVPTLLASLDDQPLAVVGLRPFLPGEATQALLEVLSLVVPLGADRLAFASVGRVWSKDDPIPPVCEEGDLRQRAVLIVLVEPGPEGVRLTTTLHPFDGEGASLVLHPPLDPEGLAPDLGVAGEVADPEQPTGPVAHLLVGTLDHRQELIDLARDEDLVGQLGRVLLLGHEVALAPDPAARLTAGTAPSPGR